MLKFKIQEKKNDVPQINDRGAKRLLKISLTIHLCVMISFIGPIPTGFRRQIIITFSQNTYCNIIFPSLRGGTRRDENNNIIYGCVVINIIIISFWRIISKLDTYAHVSRLFPMYVCTL